MAWTTARAGAPDSTVNSTGSVVRVRGCCSHQAPAANIRLATRNKSEEMNFTTLGKLCVQRTMIIHTHELHLERHCRPAPPGRDPRRGRGCGQIPARPTDAGFLPAGPVRGPPGGLL